MKTITIGRSSSCDIIIPDNNVSRVHAEISIVGGQYVFKDISKNGSTLNGEYINNRSIQISPGAPIMLSNRIPLPWAQIYALLPLRAAHPYEGETNISGNIAPQYASANVSAIGDEPSVGLNILSFFIPLAGWIMYFAMKDKTPQRASSCATWAWIGFAANIILTLVSL